MGSETKAMMADAFGAVRQMNPVLQNYQQNMAEVAASIRGALLDFQTIHDAIVASQPALQLRAIAAERARVKRILDAGYLPNRHVDWTKLHADVPEDDFGSNIEALVHDNWDEIEARFLENDYGDLDGDDSIAVMREALIAHRAGLYRAVVRLVMPEIERSVRLHFGDGRVNDTKIPAEFMKETAELPAGIVFGISGGYDTFRYIEENLYASVRTPDLLADYAANPIPNRHATVHGLLPYNSWQASVNAIFVLDFYLLLIGRVLPYRS